MSLIQVFDNLNKGVHAILGIDSVDANNRGSARVSLYGKQTNAGDTPITSDSSGALYIHQANLDRTLDTVSAGIEGDAIMSGTSVLTPQFKVISANTATDNTIVNHVGTNKIRVIAMWVGATTTGTALTFNSSTSDTTGGTLTPLTGSWTVGATVATVLPWNPNGWFQTNAGESLHFTLSGANVVGGGLVYVLV